MATVKQAPVQMLWVGGPLTALERLALTSWLANGHEVHLYSYGKAANTPKGLRICDASEILPPQADTQSSAGGQAPVRFSDMFRSYGVHLWNQSWRRNFFDKNASYDPLSLVERLKAHYLGRKEASRA